MTTRVDQLTGAFPLLLPEQPPPPRVLAVPWQHLPLDPVRKGFELQSLAANVRIVCPRRKAIIPTGYGEQLVSPVGLLESKEGRQFPAGPAEEGSPSVAGVLAGGGCDRLPGRYHRGRGRLR